MSTEDTSQPIAERLAHVAGRGDSDAERGTLAGIQAAILTEDLGAHPGDPKAASVRLLSRIAAEQTVQPARIDTEIRTIRRHSSYRRMAGWGAVAMTVLGLVVIGTQTPWGQRVSERPVLLDQLTEHRTGQGQRATILLPDSSRVVLGPMTTVRYASRFGITNRAIIVDGEVYFDVRHHTAHTFTVQAGTMTTRVLGTQFAVRSYPHDIQVVVATGKVAVTEGQQTVAIAGGNKVSLLDGQLVPSTEVYAADLLEWTDGRLVFRDTRLEDVMHDMYRWFGIRGTFSSPDIANLRLSGTVQTEAGAAVALRFITSALGVKYRATADSGHVEFYRGN